MVKARIFLLLIAAALVALGIWSMSRRGTARRPSPTPAAKTEVPIQDGKTIDFSSGQAVVKDDAASKAALERAVAAMDKAATGVTFPPTPATTTTSGTTAPAKK